jgi:DnaJ-domain-containing protein 1
VSITYTIQTDSIAVQFPYNVQAIREIKSIPYPQRQWDHQAKAWRVAPEAFDHIQRIAREVFNQTLPDLPSVGVPTPETTIATVRYLGSVKPRADGTRTASGHDGSDWRYVFPDAVLKRWFGFDMAPTGRPETSTLYATLGIKTDASPRDIKRAFRQLARQWHPDVCHEPDATRIFQQLNHAYTILSAPATRARYDAGLALSATLDKHRELTDALTDALTPDTWRPPLRSGYLLVTATPTLGRWLVSAIHQWTDIVNAQGQTLIASWPSGADSYEEQWI